MMASPANRLVRLTGLDFHNQGFGREVQNGTRYACAPAGVVQPDANVTTMDAWVKNDPDNTNNGNDTNDGNDIQKIISQMC